jgi:hypothetical protein
LIKTTWSSEIEIHIYYELQSRKNEFFELSCDELNTNNNQYTLRKETTVAIGIEGAKIRAGVNPYLKANFNDSKSHRNNFIAA